MAQTLERIEVQRTSLLPGLALALSAATASWFLARLLPSVGALTWAVGFGVLAANTGLLHDRTTPGVLFATRRLLRVGVVLLGLTLSLGSIVALGWRPLVAIVVVLVGTLVVTNLVGRRLGVGGPRRLLIAVGTAICGASAIAAVQDRIGADDEDVAAGIAMVTLFGSLAMLALPLLQSPLGLTDHQLGLWAGMSVHEVGQVVAAAQPAGAAAAAVAIVVKLTRVLMLAPVSAALSPGDRRQPPVPFFVIAFLAAVILTSLGLVPEAAKAPADVIRQLALGAGLFGLGTGVHLRRLVTGAGSTLLLGALAALLVSTLGLLAAVSVGA